MRIVRIILILSFNLALSAQGYICAVGGGSEDYNDWSNAPYNWIVEKSGHGKLIILSYSDQSEWMVDYFKSFGAAEVSNFKIGDRTTADLQSTYDEIISAKAVFIKGGDQWKYISYWKGTKTEEAIKLIYQNGGVVSGTSAGAMILGEYMFSAKNGSAYPKESLINPFYSKITLESDFLNLVPKVIFDTHVIQRGRWARVIPFVFNLYETISENVLGIAVDDMTALCIEPDGIATIMGSGAVGFYNIDENTTLSYNPPDYTIENLKCDQLTAGFVYDIQNRQIYSVPESAVEVNLYGNNSNPVTDFVLTGSNNISQNITASFDKFFTSNDTVGVIYNSSQSHSLGELEAYLSQHVQSYEMIEISSSLINDSETADIISSINKALVVGDRLSELIMLGDTSTLAGKSFGAKLMDGTPFYFLGSSGKLAGDFFIDNTDSNSEAAFKGLMTNIAGLNLFCGLQFQPLIFDDEDFYENRSAALLWGMMHNRKPLGIYLNSSDYAFFKSRDHSVEAFGSMPLMIVNATETTIIDSSVYIYSRGSKQRQVVTMNNLRYTISTEKKKYALSDGLLVALIGELKDSEVNDSFHLYDNYPNPFNPISKIRYELSQAGWIELGIYDSLGRMVDRLVSAYQPGGIYEIEFDGSTLASGVYFYRLSSNEFVKSKKMVLLK